MFGGVHRLALRPVAERFTAAGLAFNNKEPNKKTRLVDDKLMVYVVTRTVIRPVIVPVLFCTDLHYLIFYALLYRCCNLVVSNL